MAFSHPTTEASKPHHMICRLSSPPRQRLASLNTAMKQVARQRILRLLPGGVPDSGDRDPELVSRVRGGDASAALAFHDRVRPIVDRTLARLLGRHDSDYDDLAQLSLMELVATIDRFRMECPLDAWVSIVSARVIYRHLRRRKLERRLFVVDSSDNLDASERGAMHGTLLRGTIRRIENHLDKLDQKKAWAYVLHDVHGYDLAEVAEITESTVAAAQSRLVRGRKELHQRIASDPELSNLLVDITSEQESSP
jgi:RNA polymerase sigma-70 factor, ECF subfamily